MMARLAFPVREEWEVQGDREKTAYHSTILMEAQTYTAVAATRRRLAKRAQLRSSKDDSHHDFEFVADWISNHQTKHEK